MSFICISEICEEQRVLTLWSDIVNHIERGHKVIDQQELKDEFEKKLQNKRTLLTQNLKLKFDELINQAQKQINNETHEFIKDVQEFLQSSISKVKSCQTSFYGTQDFQSMSLIEKVKYFADDQNQDNFIFQDEIYQLQQILTEFSSSLKNFIGISLKQIAQITKHVNDICEEQLQRNKMLEKANQKTINELEQEQEKQTSKNLNHLNNESDEPKKNQFKKKLLNLNTKSDQVRVSNYNQYEDQSYSYQYCIEKPLDDNLNEIQNILNKSIIESNGKNEEKQENTKPLKGYKDSMRKNDVQNVNIIDERGKNNSNYEIPLIENQPQSQIYSRGQVQGQFYRSQMRRLMLDENLIKVISQNTIRRFDVDRSDKIIRFQNRFSSMYCTRKCFALLDGGFKLDTNFQAQFLLKSDSQRYEISIGMVNVTQMMMGNECPEFFGINKYGEIFPQIDKSSCQSNITLRSDCSFLLAYRSNEKQLIIVEMEKMSQMHIDLSQQDNQHLYSFFVEMNNLLVTLI